MKRRSRMDWVRRGSALLVSLGVIASCVGACTPTERQFANGNGGSGGGGNICEPLTTASCYSGPAGTEDIGVCKMGTHTCLEDGSGYGACEGEVVPSTEVCTTVLDEGCDGPNPDICPSLGHAWSKNFGGMGEDLITAIAHDPATDDVVIAGHFPDTIDFGGGPMASTGNNDIFLARFGALGEFRWSKRFGDSSSQTPWDLAIDSTGSIYLVGEMSGSADFGNGKPVTSAGSNDAFIAKFDPQGNGVWSKVLGDSMDQRAAAVAIMPTGQIVVAGNFQGFIPLTGSELPSQGGDDMFVIKFDASGFDVSGKRFGGQSYERLTSIAVDSQGSILFTGTFGGTIDFGNAGMFTAMGNADAFVAKLAPDLSEIWAHAWGDIDYQSGSSIVTSPNDDVFVMGDLVGSMTLPGGTVLTSEMAGRSVFLASLNADGKERWGLSSGNSSGFIIRQSLAVDPSSQAIIAMGFTDGTISFGGEPLVAQALDSYVAKIGWDGKHIASRLIGGPMIEALFDVAVSPNGDLFVGGGHQGPFDFGGGVLDTPAPDDIQALLMRLLP